MLRLLTAGESHGPALTAIVDGMPAGLAVDVDWINEELARRQGGHGRGKRQTIETDRVAIEAGTFHGVTTGAPISLRLVNRDSKLERLAQPAAPRGGHVDLAGAISYQTGIREVLERASARETAIRVAAGALARQVLRAVGIEVFGYVRSIGGVPSSTPVGEGGGAIPAAAGIPWGADALANARAARDASPVYALDPEAGAAMIAAIDAAKAAGDTLGGIIEVVVTGCPIGLGSHVQWDRKLDARLAAAVMSVQAIKGVEIGLGFQAACRPGSRVMDPIEYAGPSADASADEASTIGSTTAGPAAAPADRRLGFRRPTNNAGGIEGGTSNGEPIIIRAAKKPISTLAARGPSVDMTSKEPRPATYERSDVCAVPAASVVVENVVAWEVAGALLERYVEVSMVALRASMAGQHGVQAEHLRGWGDR